jgi:hexulose-6-phosphate isomerase
MNRYPLIGIMEGRLSRPRGGRIQSFPWETWREEFDLARQLGFDLIEIVFDAEDHERHPLLAPSGPEQLQETSRRTGVRTLSVCADFFMTHPLHREASRSTARSVLETLVCRARGLEIRDVVLPCVDASSLASPAEEEALKEELRRIHPLLEEAGVNLALETDLDPLRFKAFLDDVPLKHISVNYDTGNSASLGFSAAAELGGYGRRISSVHIKDRRRRGTTVAFGTGNADFPAFFAALRTVEYRGALIIQGARGDDDREVAASQLRFTRDCLEKHFL